MHPSLAHLDHRPWPLPDRPWIGRQTWNDLVFLHWPVPRSILRPLVDARLELDEFDGTAWMGVTPFHISDVALRELPPIPGASAFPELNVRTYVRFEDRPGVWFFSLDAGHRLAVLAARVLYRLPYVFAEMSVALEGERIVYRSKRRSGPGFEASYGPEGPVFRAEPGSFDHWSTERYRLYALSPTGSLYSADIHHAPWPLQPASADLDRNDMLAVHGLHASGSMAPPRFVRRIDVIIWPLESVRPASVR